MSVYLLAGGVGQAEDQGQVQRVRAGGQRFMEHPAAADPLDADAVPLQVSAEEAPGDRPGAEGGLPGDQDVPVGGARPGGAAVAEPGPQRPMDEFAEPLAVPAEGDAPVGQVKVVQVRSWIAAQRAAWTAARTTISRRTGPAAARPAARISAPVIGGRLPPGSAAFSRAAGLAKTSPRLLANRNSDRTAVVVVRSWATQQIKNGPDVICGDLTEMAAAC